MHILQKIKACYDSKHYNLRNYNFMLIGIVLLICIMGTFTLWIIGSGYNTTADYKKHLFGIVIGLVIMLFVSIIDYHFICRFVIILYIAVTFLVAATRLTPLGTNNGKDAYRWLDFPNFQLQPSELCKVMVIIAIAVALNKLQNKLETVWPIVVSFLIMAVPLAFILYQPDLSSSIVIIFSVIIMVFASGIAYKILLPFIGVAIPAFIVGFWYIQQPDPMFIKDYQVGRIIGFLHPDLYPDIAYQQLESIDAISSGRLYGKYILEGISEIRLYNRVDVTESDFIWSAIGEEFGFIGSLLFIAIFIIFISLCLLVVKNSVDYLGKMIAIGISSMFMFQIFANIGVSVMILPNTGLPLPFVSSGLSSMLTYIIAIGIMLNIGIQPVSKAFGRGFLIKNEPMNLNKLKYDKHVDLY
ncbi:MAG: hypothetical protein E7270_12100 [Lachnospiraceae bacterium]|nr:hypothetical protein [Lachnospiraceae bacterium]